jgi:hypothetical protein
VSRPFARAGAWRRHAAFALLLALVAPLMVAFAWQHGLSTFNDDGFSYLTLARWMQGDPVLAEWAWQHAHFPPLFPLLLAATGGARDFAVAHLAVAACAVLALVAVYAFCARALGSASAALALAVLFVLAPTAWLGIKGILSEPLYLLVTFLALHWHAARMEGQDVRVRDAAVLGVLLALACLARSIGMTLVLAYALHAAWRFVRARGRGCAPLLVPAVPVVAALFAWVLVRPGSGSAYSDQFAQMLGHWRDNPPQLLRDGGLNLFHGWISSFHSQTVTEPVPTAIFAAFAVLALAGSIGRAAANRLDGWYVLLTVPLLYFWIFPADTARRLLYPVFPLLLLHAAFSVRWIASRAPVRRYARLLAAGAFLLAAALCMPAAVVLAQKAGHRTPLAGTSLAYADILDYFLLVNEAEAEKSARVQLATFAGFERTARETPAAARVMWSRPEYVALLAARVPVAFEYRWDALQLALELKATRTDYVVLSEVYKVDRNLEMGNPQEALRDLPRYAAPALEVKLPGADRVQFMLMKVDRARLEAYIAERVAALSARRRK